VRIFMNLGVLLGASWDPLWMHFCDVSVIVGAKMGDCLQVHGFGDPGLEMMVECRGCMWLEYNQGKDCCFSVFSLFPLFVTRLVSEGRF